MIAVVVLSVLSATSAALFSQILSQKEKAHWWKAAAALLLLVAVLIVLVYWTAVNDLGGVLAFIVALYASIFSLLAGLAVLVAIPRPRTILRLGLALAIPLTLFSTVWIAEGFSPTSIARKDGVALAQEIEHYKQDTGSYPETLDDLIPEYRTNIKEPNTYEGWLYAATNQDFMLGYVAYIDKWGYTVCLISSGNREWKCSTDLRSPFGLGPTPAPTGLPVPFP